MTAPTPALLPIHAPRPRRPGSVVATLLCLAGRACDRCRPPACGRNPSRARLRSAAALTLPLALALIGAAPVAARAEYTVWDELFQGELTSDWRNPNRATAQLGQGVLRGSTGRGDRDFLMLTVPEGMELAQLRLMAYLSSDAVAFIGIAPGAALPFDPDAPVVEQLLGYALFGPGGLDRDYLPEMGTAPGALGFSPPLPAGHYTFWIQQLGASTEYQWELVVTPEPAGLAALGLAALLGVGRRR